MPHKAVTIYMYMYVNSGHLGISLYVELQYMLPRRFTARYAPDNTHDCSCIQHFTMVSVVVHVHVVVV